MSPLDLKSLAKNKVCGLGGWEESLGISKQKQWSNGSGAEMVP